MTPRDASERQALVADVRMSGSLDRLVVTPRSSAARNAVARALRAAMPGVKFTLAADGIRLNPWDGPTLLEVIPPIDLRWTAQAEICAQNRRDVLRVHQLYRQTVSQILSGGRAAADIALGDDPRLSPLDDHQRVNVAAMTAPEGYGLCLFDEQGAGKTVSLIFAFDRLCERDEAEFALIVGPKSMITEWERDFRRFMGSLYVVAIATGTRRQRALAIARDADVVVTNFETTVLMEAELRARLRRHGRRAVLAVDESFFVKSLDAKRTQALRRLREFCGRAYVLCGTPAPNAAHDLVQQFNLVDLGVTFDQVVVPKDPAAARAAVQQAINDRGVFVRHLKAQVLPDLPPKTFTSLLLPLQPLQERAYRGALNGLIADLQSTDDETFHRQLGSYLARRQALLQICSFPAAVVPGYDETPAKLLALDMLLEELVERKGEKVVVWSFYRASTDALMERYSRFNPVRYDGKVDRVSERREAVRRFQEDVGTPLFIGNPAAAGAGLTLHRARYAIYESLSNQAAHYLQSLDRIHRRGQARDVEYLMLLCDGTLELAEYRRLTEKERDAQELLGDRSTPPSTRVAMLEELVQDRHAAP